MISYVIHEQNGAYPQRLRDNQQQRRRFASAEDEEDTEGIECDDAPTVVIDDSVDE